MPDAGAGRRLPAAVRAAPGARPGRPGDDRRDGRPGGVHRGQVPDARQADAGARRDPARSPPSSRRAFGRDVGRPRPRLPHRGRRDDRRRARLGARHDRGRRRRAARAGRADRRARRSSASGRSRSTRCARRSRRAERVVVLEKALAVGVGGIVSARTCGWRCRACQPHGLRRRRRPRRPADHQALAADARSRDVLAAGSSCGRCTSSTSTARRRRARARARCAAGGRTGPHAENILRDIGIVAARLALRSAMADRARSSSTRSGTFAVGNRLLDPEQRSVQARMDRSNTLTSGHRACQGCGEALGARYVLDAAMRATDGQLIAANATGCLEVFSTPYPGVLVAASLDPLAVRQRARGRDGDRRGAARPRAATTSGWSARAATAAPSTSASPACRGCSSATTTCSSSATTTRPT